MTTDKHLVVFQPSGKRGHFEAGTSVLEASRSLGVDIDSVCGGRGICGRCQINVVEGHQPKHGITSTYDALSEFSANEQRYKERKGLAEGRRLGCHSKILKDIIIDVPPTSQVHRQIIVKSADNRKIEMDPAIRLHYVDVQEPDMHNPKGDLERLKEALQHQWGLGDLECDLRILQKLQKALRKGKWQVTVAVHREQRITAIWPGFQDKAYGIAVDIGSTTIAMHLCDLSTGDVIATQGIMNPQIRYGEDLMSRVSYIMMNEDSDKLLTEAVRGGINDLVANLVEETGIDREFMLNATFVGNPIMHHLLLGMDPTELGGAPFALTTNTSMTLWATEIDLDINPDGRVYILPCIAGHVGSDTTGAILSSQIHKQDKISLLVDVGTNAELALGNNERILAASSPTGPAFEGAQIACGQRATAGAIERVRIDPQTKQAKVKVIGCDLWSDHPEFSQQTQSTGVTGICGSGIIEALAEMYLAEIMTDEGVIRGDLFGVFPQIEQTDRTFSYTLFESGDTVIRVYQSDVRAIQLAKAALYAGARLLMDKLGVEKVDQVLLAGAFGSHIDTLRALVLGMFPDCKVSEVKSIGNAAGSGARIALLNNQARQEAEDLVQFIEKIETAVEPKFQEYFVDAMSVPHKTDSFSHLEQEVKLPERIAPAETKGRRKRRRNRV